MINDAADRGAQLTANLLAFASKQPLRPAETDVNALIGEAVELLSPTLGRQIEIETGAERRGLAGIGRPQPAHRGAGQSRHQRPRRHARWRQADCSRPAISRSACPPGDGERASSAPATTSPSRSSTPAPAFRRPSATGFSSRSFRPRSSAQARGSGSAWCSALPSSPAAASRSQRGRKGHQFPDLSAEGRHQGALQPPPRRTMCRRGRHGNHPVRRG